MILLTYDDRTEQDAFPLEHLLSIVVVELDQGGERVLSDEVPHLLHAQLPLVHHLPLVELLEQHHLPLSSVMFASFKVSGDPNGIVNAVIVVVSTGKVVAGKLLALRGKKANNSNVVLVCEVLNLLLVGQGQGWRSNLLVQPGNDLGGHPSTCVRN